MTNLYKGNSLIGNALVSYARSFDHPFKIRIINGLIAFFNPSGLKLKGAFGELLHISPSNYIGHQLIYAGSYEPKSLQLALSLLNGIDNPVFVDIGANIGLYSVPCAKISGIILYAVEPTAKNFWKLQQNFALNKDLTKQLHLLNVALSDESNFSYITNPIEGNDGTFRVEQMATNKSYMIAVTTFDQVIKHHSITHIDLLKMDVEGYEGKVLDGFKLIDKIRPKNIIMEFSDYVERVGNKKKEIYEYLISLGYESLTVDGQSATAIENLPEDNIWFRLQ
jgi:FkbM family methyltransferase